MARPRKLTPKILELIIDKMSQGYALEQVCREFKDQVGISYSAVIRTAVADPEVSSELDRGYTLWYFCKLEELDRLSTGLASDFYPNADFREAEAALKRRIDTLKFSLGKMAPILSKRFDKTEKVEITNSGPAQLAVINYYAQPSTALEKVIEAHKLTLDSLASSDSSTGND